MFFLVAKKNTIAGARVSVTLSYVLVARLPYSAAAMGKSTSPDMLESAQSLAPSQHPKQLILYLPE